MNAAMPELRSAVMIVVEVSWEDNTGACKRESARMEDKSPGGACLRLKTAVAPGAKLRVQWRFEQFSGVVKYCRSEGHEFVVGIQRDKETDVAQPASPKSQPKADESPALVVSPPKIESPPERENSRDQEIPANQPLLPMEPVARIPSPALSIPAHPDGPTMKVNIPMQPAAASPPKSAALRGIQIETPELREQKEVDTERKPMRRKWLDLAPWHNKQGDIRVSGNSGSEAQAGANHNGKGGTGAAARGPASTENNVDCAAENLAGGQIELLPLEDLYLAAGIVQPRKRSIHRVVEMLRSEHLRGLSREMKRAAVLMALEVAAVSVEQVLRDAKAREEALDSYEAVQRKQAQAEWARKAEENVKIQSDLERVKAQFMARIIRNLEGVAREQSAFSNWQTLKRQEAQNIAEAAELCLVKPAIPEAAASQPPEVSMAASANAKP